MGTDQNQQPASRRQVLAHIALLDLPVPTAIDFRNDGTGDEMTVTLASTHDATVWAAQLNVKTTSWTSKNCRAYMSFGTNLLGRPAWFCGEDEPQPDEGLDDATREQLTEVIEAASEPAATGGR